MAQGHSIIEIRVTGTGSTLSSVEHADHFRDEHKRTSIPNCKINQSKQVHKEQTWFLLGLRHQGFIFPLPSNFKAVPSSNPIIWVQLLLLNYILLHNHYHDCGLVTTPLASAVSDNFHVIPFPHHHTLQVKTGVVTSIIPKRKRGRSREGLRPGDLLVSSVQFVLFPCRNSTVMGLWPLECWLPSKL